MMIIGIHKDSRRKAAHLHRMALFISALFFLWGCPEKEHEEEEETIEKCEGSMSGPCLCKDSEEICDETQWCDRLAGACVESLPDLCRPGTAWKPGTVIFRDASSDYGFDELGVEGQRISIADIDGDGYPDLAIRRAGGGYDDFSPEGRRVNWLLRNTGDRGFEDITQSSGFAMRRHEDNPDLGRPMEVVIFADVNGNGFTDAFTGWKGGDDTNETSEIMLNDGSGNFILGPEDNALRREGESFNLAGAAFTDINLDGHLDLWIGYGATQGILAQDRLFRGNGTGRFYDLTSMHNLGTRAGGGLDDLNMALTHSNAWGVTACDLSGDGIPELLTASYGRAPNRLWLGGRDEEGMIVYTNHSVESGYAYDHRMDWSDNESARCWCKHNRDDDECEDIPEPRHIRCWSEEEAIRWNHAIDREPFRLGGNSATTVCADINGNGILDLLTTEIVHWDVGDSSDPSEILYNTGETPLRFERPGPEATGLSREKRVPWDFGDMTAAVFDADNSGRMDILIGSSDYPGTRAWLFIQQEDGTFMPVPLDEGIDHKSSHGVGIADLNRNGSLDVILGHSRARCSSGDHCYETASARVFENVLAAEGNWIQIDLADPEESNTGAVGAQVTVRFGDRIQLQEVGGGYGHYGAQQDRILHFGLGSECEAEVTVRWPDRDLKEQSFTARTGYRYKVIKGEGAKPVI